MGDAHEDALNRYRRALSRLSDDALSPRQRHDNLLAAVHNLQELPLSTRLESNLELVSGIFSDDADVIIRRVQDSSGRQAALIYVDGMVARELLTSGILQPLVASPTAAAAQGDPVAVLRETVITAGEVRSAATIGRVVEAVLEGKVAVLVDGATEGTAVGIPGAKGRAVEEPVAESVIRGPREGFTESLSENTAMLRRRLRSPFLRIEILTLGRSSQTRVAVTYLQDIADPPLVKEVRRRLEEIDIDAVIDSAYIEELIEENPFTVFPQIQNTERPDTVAGNLLEGRIAILTDNSPFALIMPVTLWTFFQASEDHYERFPIAAFLRLLRFLLGGIAVVGPAMWIAMLSFHQELLPTALLITAASSREGIPFPVAVEAFVMEVFFEALREAGVRLPRPVGQAVSIVGALVIGEAAVGAGLVSAPMVIIVAATGIASFTIPRFNFGITLRLVRFGIMILASTLGLFGIMMGMLFTLFHLCTLRSFGVPYLQPIAPLTASDLKDTLIRLPRWLLDRRPEFMKVLDRRRSAPRLQPRPPGGSSPS